VLVVVAARSSEPVPGQPAQAPEAVAKPSAPLVPADGRALVLLFAAPAGWGSVAQGGPAPDEAQPPGARWRKGQRAVRDVPDRTLEPAAQQQVWFDWQEVQARVRETCGAEPAPVQAAQPLPVSRAMAAREREA
jgi:hypothetical protein